MTRWRQAAVAVSLAVAAVACGGGGSGSGGTDPLAPAAAPTVKGAPPAGYADPVTLGQITDPDLDESSGLAASRRNPGLLWTHNDSGDGPFVYCFDMAARACGVWRVTGASAVDWEDMAAGPGPVAGQPYLYLGDIGDNSRDRAQVIVYRVPEPATIAPAPTKAAPAATVGADALRLKYPDGPHDAEALLVHPVSGDLYVVTKDPVQANVYKAAAPLDASTVTTLTMVGSLRLGLGIFGPELVTGGDIAPDGGRLALCTYTRAYELALPEGAGAGAVGFDAIWKAQPTQVVLGSRAQGESIAYRLDGRALLTTSEKSPTPLGQVEHR